MSAGRPRSRTSWAAHVSVVRSAGAADDPAVELTRVLTLVLAR
ncbi:MAG: hypothetical protein QOF00_5021 [Pseudonocardiales bacterium]|jgi:hypothetical protein|nr:hypothetical protein [Pseudonocardiales bacterium]